MEITLRHRTSQRKNDRLVIFNIEGRTGCVQFLKTLFPKDAVPPTLTLTGTFATPETPEARKARLAAITPAERLAKMEERVTKMKAKLAAQTDTPKAPEQTMTRAKGRRQTS